MEGSRCGQEQRRAHGEARFADAESEGWGKRGRHGGTPVALKIDANGNELASAQEEIGGFWRPENRRKCRSFESRLESDAVANGGPQRFGALAQDDRGF